MNQNTTRFRLIVDTNAYSGNFERQSVAYATGQVGECGVGDRQAERAREELPADILTWWSQHTLHVADEDGCARPGNIWPTPGLFNHGLGEHFPTTDEGRAAGLANFKAIKRNDLNRRREFLDKVVLGESGWTQKNLDRAREDHERQVLALEAMDKVNEWPAYQSVAVETDAAPPQHVIDSFDARMREFLATQKVEVLAVRVEEEEHVIRKREVFRR